MLGRFRKWFLTVKIHAATLEVCLTPPSVSGSGIPQAKGNPSSAFYAHVSSSSLCSLPESRHYYACHQLGGRSSLWCTCVCWNHWSSDFWVPNLLSHSRWTCADWEENSWDCAYGKNPKSYCHPHLVDFCKIQNKSSCLRTITKKASPQWWGLYLFNPAETFWFDWILNRFQFDIEKAKFTNGT